jgi:hypothetical protein
VPAQLPRFKLLVSAVVPASDAHVGASLVPFDTATFTIKDEPELKVAAEPSPSPTMLNSDSFQAVARSTRHLILWCCKPRFPQ